MNKAYNFLYWQLKTETDDEFIDSSISYYFSIYDNIKNYFNTSCQLINLTLYSFDKFNLSKLFKDISTSNEKTYSVNRRFVIYKLQNNEYIVSFYKNTCICKFDLVTKEIIGWFDRPTRFGIDFIPNFIVIALIEILFKFENKFFIHSSSLKKNDKGIIISGVSGSGKSTLAFFLMTHGWQLLSDDKTFVWQESENIKIAGLLQPVDIIKNKDDFLLNSGIIEKIADNIKETPKTKIIAAFKSVFIGNTVSPNIILFPKVSNNFSTIKLDKKNALVNLMKSSITPNFNINLDKHFKILNKTIEKSESYNISIGKDLSKILFFLETLL